MTIRAETGYSASRNALEDLAAVVAAAIILLGVALVNVDWGLTNPFGRLPLPQTGGPRDY